MRKTLIAVLALFGTLAVFAAGARSNAIVFKDPAVISFTFVTLTVLGFYAYFEDARRDVKLIAIIASLSAVASGGRVLFAAVPNVQPATFIIAVTGYVFGALPGFMVGSTTAVVSNIFIGQGPWTVWQMLGWGLCGLVSGFLRKKDFLKKRFIFSIYCAFWGFLFGWIMNLYFVLGYVKPLVFKSFILSYSSSLGFDAFHAVGNFIFAFLLGPLFIEMLQKYRARLFIEIGDPSGNFYEDSSGVVEEKVLSG